MAGTLKIALGCTYLRQCHLGNCPYGIATQDGKLRKRLNVQKGAEKVANFINAATKDVTSIARICGKTSLTDLNKNDLVSLDPELSRITNIAMA